MFNNEVTHSVARKVQRTGLPASHGLKVERP
jgi:hypothetical protein